MRRIEIVGDFDQLDVDGFVDGLIESLEGVWGIRNIAVSFSQREECRHGFSSSAWCGECQAV